MGIENWLDGSDPDQLPLFYLDQLDADPDLARYVDDGGAHYHDDQAITDAGYDSRSTPVDTLMAGPVSMHLQHAHNMEHCDCY